MVTILEKIRETLAELGAQQIGFLPFSGGVRLTYYAEANTVEHLTAACALLHLNAPKVLEILPQGGALWEIRAHWETEALTGRKT